MWPVWLNITSCSVYVRSGSMRIRWIFQRYPAITSNLVSSVLTQTLTGTFRRISSYSNEVTKYMVVTAVQPPSFSNKINNKMSSSTSTSIWHMYIFFSYTTHFISFSHIIECIYIPIIQHFLEIAYRKLFHPFYTTDNIFNLWKIQLDENKRKSVF